MKEIPSQEARELLCRSEELLVAIKINKIPSAECILQRATGQEFVQSVCAATLKSREVWLDAVKDSPEYPRLLEIGREKNVPLHEAIKQSRVEIIRLMLKHGVDINERPMGSSQMPLEICVTHNKQDLLCMFLDEHGADPNVRNQLLETPLFHALRIRNTEALVKLLEHKADPNAVDSFGQTPLLFFMKDKELQTHDHDILDQLLEYGADCNKVTQNSGLAPLHVLLSNHSIPTDVKIMITEMLLEQRADVDIKDSVERTPLHYVCDLNMCNLDAANRCKLVSLLIQFGANPNAKDISFRTPLHLAAAFGFAKVVETLTEKNADPKLRDIDGKRPCDLVPKDSEISSILEEAAAKPIIKSQSSSSSNKSDSSSNIVTIGVVSNPDIQGLGNIESNLANNSNSLKISLTRLEDAISELTKDYDKKTPDNTNNLSKIVADGEDTVDGLMNKKFMRKIPKAISQITAEFSKLKSSATALQNDVKNVRRALRHQSRSGTEILHSFIPDIPTDPDKDKALMYRAIKQVASLVGHDWKMLMRTLEFKDTFEVEVVIKEIEDKYSGQLREQAYQSMLHWIQRYGTDANFDTLLEALQECELQEIVDRLVSLREEYETKDT